MHARRLLVGALFAVLLTAPAAYGREAGDACCYDVITSAVYDVNAKTVTIAFRSITGFHLNDVLAATGTGAVSPSTGRLEADYKAGGKELTHVYGESLRGASSPLTVKVDAAGDFWVQLVFNCDSWEDEKCDGSYIHASKPVQVRVGKAPTVKTTAKTAPLPADNGTAACRAARARIKYLNQELEKAVANLNVVNRLSGNAGVQKTRRQQLQTRISRLESELGTKAVPQGKTACKKT